MARIYRAASYLLRRGASWYFRYRLPAEIQLVAGRAELRLSLYTGELAVARIRAGQLLPFVFSLKRLNRHMARLTPDIAKQVLDEFARVVDALRSAGPLCSALAPTRRAAGRAVHSILPT